MVLLNDGQVSSYTIREDRQALELANVRIKVEHNSLHDTDEEGIQATGSKDYDNSQGDGRIIPVSKMEADADRTNEVASEIIVNGNIDLVASNYYA